MTLTATFPRLAGRHRSVPDLVLRGVAHTYRPAFSRPAPALAPTDLTIDGGAVVALVGPAESGKSTLLDIVAGRRLPSEGVALLGGTPVSGPGRRGTVIRPSGADDLRRQLEQALASDLDLLLFDEPFAGVADHERESLHEELRGIWRRTGKTMVLAARSRASVEPLATRVIVLSAHPGDIVEDVHVGVAWPAA